MKTAMQELIDEIKEAVPYFKMDIYEPNFNKALEKEKEQIIEAYNSKVNEHLFAPITSINKMNGEEYYNQTYKPETI